MSMPVHTHVTIKAKHSSKFFPLTHRPTIRAFFAEKFRGSRVNMRGGFFTSAQSRHYHFGREGEIRWVFMFHGGFHYRFSISHLILEMVDAMKKVASTDVELTVEERNLLSVAYKNVIGARRASWRIISSIEQKEENKGFEEKLEMIKSYRAQVEKELRDICSDILDVLDKHLIPCATTGESKVFYYKMKGDYHRYLAEFATGNDRKEAAENSLVAYKAASDIAMTDLPPTHPIRLGLALNFSVSF